MGYVKLTSDPSNHPKVLRRLLLLGSLTLASLPACRRREEPPREGESVRAALRQPSERSAPSSSHENVRSTFHSSAPRPPERCFVGDLPGAPPRPLGPLLDRAAERFEATDHAAALRCAEEAARVDPASVEAHHDRAAALMELERLDEARDAFARALALQPDDPETLAAIADFYVNRLPPSEDHTETGLAYARRGSRLLRRHRSPAQRRLAARLALVEGQGLGDLGRPKEALGRLEAALGEVAREDEWRVLYERAVALYELCRFADARRAFAEVLARRPDDPWAHHHLGLTLERLGDPPAAEQALAQARTLSPREFPPPVALSAAGFQALVDEEVARLPPPQRRDLGAVRLETADLPELADLTAEEPTLSPSILGLFRGSPVGEPGAGPCAERTIVLYRKNLLRAVRSPEELRQQVRTTLLHELGHLRGEDDAALRARGLE